jgi:ankyrin repeat protein
MKRVRVLNELLGAGVDIELLNRERETALDVAGAAFQLDAMDLLIKAGADRRLAGRR